MILNNFKRVLGYIEKVLGVTAYEITVVCACNSYSTVNYAKTCPLEQHWII